MAEQDAVLRISAEIDEYKRILSKLPDVTEKEARRAASRMAQQLAKGQIAAANQATKSAAQAGKAWRNSTTDTKAGFESLKQAAEAFGGEVGAAAGVVEKLGRSFLEAGKAIGPVGTAIGGLAIGVAAVGLAAVGAGKAIFAMVDAAEHKRKQAPPVLKVTGRAFGAGRRMPIAQRYAQPGGT